VEDDVSGRLVVVAATSCFNWQSLGHMVVCASVFAVRLLSSVLRAFEDKYGKSQPI